MDPYRYREILYKDYFVNQSGRGAEEAFHARLAVEKRQLENEIIPLLPNSRNSKILDIGCGFGSLVYYLKAKGYTNIIGIDVSESQVKMAHQLGLKEVIQGDLITYLKENPNSFDVILGIDIIEHFGKNELVDLIALIHQALKPKGTAIFRTPNLDAPFASIFANGDFTHENYMNAYAANQVFSSCGFSNVSILPAYLHTEGTLKELIRKIIWFKIKLYIRLIIFASGRSSKYVLFTPNMIICTQK